VPIIPVRMKDSAVGVE